MTSIHDICQKIKTWSEKDSVLDVYIIILVFLVGFALLGLSKIIFVTKTPPQIEYGTSSATQFAGNIVASKNSTKYYFSRCSGISRIKEGNRIYFSSEEEARAAGYVLATGCK